MRFPGKATVAGLSLSLTAGTAWGADVCARAPDLVALQVAALQQQLMVAALTCDDVPLYNNFVTAYQKDLLASDEALQAFFDRFGSEEGMPAYHSFKTKMANLYSARSASDKQRFCTNARATFGPALKTDKVSLASFAMSQPSTVSEPYTNCGETVAGGAMVTRTPVVAPTPPSNLLTAQNAAQEAKGAGVAAANAAPPTDTPLSTALPATPPSASAATTAAAAAEAKQTAQLNNSQAAPSASNQQPGTTTAERSPYYQGYGVGYARERERARQQAASGQENDTSKTAGTAKAGGQAATGNPNQQRDVTRSARSRSASEAYRERLAQQRAAARERAAQRPSVRYRDRYDTRGYYWPADPYWQYCYTRYGVRMSCAEAAQRFRSDRYYYRAPYDDGGYYPSR
jgi:hypothetical protein